MRFPIKQTIAVAKSIVKNKRAGIPRFPLVLMLEPLHACNLKCEGCGRIREYAATLSQQLPLDKCIKAINDSQAPVVSICGGEPLLYKDIAELVRKSLDLGKVTYLCTNGTILDWKLDILKPHPMFNINVHIDGMEKTHDAITKRPGTFRQITENIRLAKKAGFTICTNTTVYKETSPEEIGDLFAHLQFLGVDGMLVSPGFDYSDVEERAFFMTASEIRDKFSKIRKYAKKCRVWSTPLYLDFLAGLRKYNCTPWGNVTYNIEGWKAPCYLITDRHFADFNEFMNSVDWTRYQSRADKRCQNCMVHSGFEATVALETGSNLKDGLRMAWWTIF
ncbi:MAG: adenosyl-hopene transferase HpnH [Deltaproteobacteria bacterium]|nr:adenosyl-hopene transferase HpnH [Deltaproteobacteria bacterium]MBI2975164.1 adenosyl-hopene transferase HpnH [Deltaproteobacteria bacterium]